MLKIINADGKSEYAFLKELERRNTKTDPKIENTVRDIIENVYENGDNALKEYSLKFDKADLECFEVAKEEMEKAYNSVSKELILALEGAKENIFAFHQKQLREGYVIDNNGAVTGQKIRGLKRVGIYVPGGTAAYPSSVLMNAIPAKVAGVKEIIMVTPPSKNGLPNPDILAAAKIAGVDRIFLIGGAQAVAALAYGTETIPKVDKIVGPGNIYVATAKRLLFGTVDIDMIAGPSEILIIADETATPKFLAADMLSQAEHDMLASSILVTTSKKVAEETTKELYLQLEKLPRKEIAQKSIEDYGVIIICDHIDKAVELANEISPEHLEIVTKEPQGLLNRLDNAGSIFLGEYSPEPLGDYFAGPNHVLPTNGTARFFSPLSTDSFMKKTSFIYYDEKSLKAVKDKITTIADAEGLTAHSNSIKIRFEN